MTKPRNINIPRATFAAMVHAIRLATRDSRGTDRSLHDETRKALVVADDAVRDFLDARTGIA